jgi:glycosyltransferase involved in cell wall biosynthesis
MRASVVIITKNRRDELRAAIASALTQSVQLEVLVVDDGSTDGTSDMVRAEFPVVRLERSTESLGYVVQRNQAARLASGDIIFSLDDDAEFSTPRVVKQTLEDFDDPRIGAVAVPYVEPKKVNRLMQSPPDTSSIWITDTFIGTAHALRRDLFLALGGYREPLFHQGEEGDFTLRLLEAGYLVRLGRSDSIRHWESPKRDFRRMDFYSCRNAILFATSNVPWPALPVHLAATTFNCLRWSLSPRRLWLRLKGVIAGYQDSADYPRRPVSWSVYLLHRELKKQGSRRLAEIEKRLPLQRLSRHVAARAELGQA